jgi:hypothetical protein
MLNIMRLIKYRIRNCNGIKTHVKVFCKEKFFLLNIAETQANTDIIKVNKNTMAKT